MNLISLYSRRMIKNLGNPRTAITMAILIAIVVIASLTITFAPLTPPTEESLMRLARSLNLPNNQISIAIAFYAVEFPLFLALFSSVLVSLIPQRVISFERSSGNMELLLSRYGNIREIVLALMVASLLSAAVVYFIFTGVGFITILAFEAIYSQSISFPSSFYLFIFGLDPTITILAVSISHLLTVSFPSFSSMEVYALTSSPLQIVSYAPALIIILAVTILPITPKSLELYALPITVVLVLMSLVVARKTMKRDMLVRK